MILKIEGIFAIATLGLIISTVVFHAWIIYFLAMPDLAAAVVNAPTWIPYPKLVFCLLFFLVIV